MKLFRRTTTSRPILILGAGTRAAKIYRDFVDQKSPAHRQIKGFVPLAEVDSVIPERLLIRNNETLLKISGRVKAIRIVIAKDYPHQVCPVQQLLDCKLAGLHLESLENFLASTHEEYASRTGSFNSLVAACISFRWY